MEHDDGGAALDAVVNDMHAAAKRAKAAKYMPKPKLMNEAAEGAHPESADSEPLSEMDLEKLLAHEG